MFMLYAITVGAHQLMPTAYPTANPKRPITRPFTVLQLLVSLPPDIEVQSIRPTQWPLDMTAPVPNSTITGLAS